MSKFAKIQMWLSSAAVHGKVGSDEPWLSAVKYLHQEYAKTQSQIGPLEKYLHQEYVKTRYQIVSLSKKSAPGKISASGICENSKSNRFTREVSTDQKKYLHKEYICQNLISNAGLHKLWHVLIS